MKRISRWASHHPGLSRIIIVVSHFILLFVALYMGILSYFIDWRIPGWSIFVVGNLFFASFILYPVKSGKGSQDSFQYYRHKMTDFALILTAMLTIAGGVNQFAYSPTIQFNEALPQAHQIVERSVIPDKSPENVGLFKQLRQKLSNVIQSVKHQLKVHKALFAKDSEGTGNRTGIRILYIFLALLVALFLSSLVAVLACNIACSGAEGLALVVLILGWGGILWLLVITIQYIIRNTGGTGTKLKQQI